jgi:hypothetical protein
LLQDAVSLKDGIAENFDFVTVSADVWMYLGSWFGYDFAIRRFIDYDQKTDNTFLRLY